MLKVAARYDVSSSYMARVCILLNVPRPERGYWVKLAVGKAPPKPPLPEARPGDESVWTKGGGPYFKKNKALPRPPSKRHKQKLKPSASKLRKHPLISGAKHHFEKQLYVHDVGYLKPTKKLLVDLVVSKPCLDNALSFANKLFLLLESKGHHVVIAPKSEKFQRESFEKHEVPKNYNYHSLWSPWRCTVVYIGTVAIGLTIVEMSEEVKVRYVNGKYIPEKDYAKSKRRRYSSSHTWTTTKEYPTGRLLVQAYSPYYRANWAKSWKEAKEGDLIKQIKTIVKSLERSTPKIARLIEEGERQAELERKRWEAQQEKWRKEEEERRAAEALEQSREQLFQVIDTWAKANQIEQFFKDVKQRANGLSEDKKLKILERLQKAREMIGSIEALEHFVSWRAPDEIYSPESLDP
jgi:hypothetical protein